MRSTRGTHGFLLAGTRVTMTRTTSPISGNSNAAQFRAGRYWQADGVGRKARERDSRKAEHRANTVALPHPILVLWSYPGAGKSHFARWLSNEHEEFDWIDTDSLATKLRSPLEEAWW